MWDEMFKKQSRSISDFSTDDILSALGLQRRSTPFDAAMPTTLAFLAGAAAGAGVALLLAPKSGRELRQDISNKASQLSSDISSKASQLSSDISNKASQLTSLISSSASEAVEEGRQALTSGSNDRGDQQRTYAGTTGSNRSTS